MLTRRTVFRGLLAGACVAGAGLVTLLLPGPAGAAEPVDCPPQQDVCTVHAERPGQTATNRAEVRSGPAGSTCRVPGGRQAGVAVPCTDPVFGTWSNTDGCYYRRLEPQPPASDPAWEGHIDGAVYQATCSGTPGTGGGWVWRVTPPAGPGAGVTPAVLAQRAIRSLQLSGPQIRMAPPEGSMGLVHVPVWLWTPVTPSTWGPASATASVPGLSVTAVARAVAIRWDLGDGHTITCTGPGTVYQPGRGTASPACGHTYERSSAGHPGNAYPVTAVTTWRITWSGGGDSGALTATRTSHASVRIGEMQALT